MLHGDEKLQVTVDYGASALEVLNTDYEVHHESSASLFRKFGSTHTCTYLVGPKSLEALWSLGFSRMCMLRREVRN